MQIAMVFPGQGSQALHMLADVAEQFSEVQHTFELASTVLGYDVWQLCQQGPLAKLNQTVYTQPVLLTASYAIAQIIASHSALRPTFFAGHSLGEYTALVCANAMSFSDALSLVAARAKYMQEAVMPDAGAMAVIVGLDDATVAAICKQAAEPVEVVAPANFNSPGQIVIAGDKAPILRAMALANAANAKLVKLISVSVPSHCDLMRPAALLLAAQLASVTFSVPQIAVLNNVDVARYDTVAAIRDGLVRQLFMPVRWVEVIQHFVKEGITQVVECGPGKVLTGLNKRIDKRLQCYSTGDLRSLRDVLKAYQK